jgi:hypothetical protein
MQIVKYVFIFAAGAALFTVLFAIFRVIARRYLAS